MDLQGTESNRGHSFVPIIAKWMASGTDDDDDEYIYKSLQSLTFELNLTKKILITWNSNLDRKKSGRVRKW